jgi:predicted phage terminase large subunit-like protein
MNFKGAANFFKAYKWGSKLAMLGAWLVSAVRNHKVVEDRRRRGVGLSTLGWGQCYLPAHFSKPPSQMHLWIGRQLDTLHLNRGTKLNVLGPRGGAKSTIGTLCYVLRAAVEGWEQYIWIISDTRAQGLAHLNNIRAELESNPLLAEHYPRARCKNPGQAGNAIKLTNGTVIESFGAGQRLRGRRLRAARPSLIVCDDLQNDGHIESAHQRDLSRRWFQSALINAGDKLTNFINLATALHRDALAMELDRTPGWRSARFQSIEAWPVNMHLWQEWEKIYCDAKNEQAELDAREFFELHLTAMQAGADVLWPDEEDLYTLMKMRVESGHAAFEREKQNSPTDPTRCEWPAEYFGEHIWFDAWPADVPFKVIALDPSKGGDGRHGDYSALVVLGFDRQGTAYVEANLARRDASQIVVDGTQLCRAHRADVLGVEANLFQELLVADFIAEFARQGIHWCDLSQLHNTVPKKVRIRKIGPWLSQRRMRFRAGDASTELLVNQLRDFPLGSHDDGPDALEMALRLAEDFQRGPVDDGLGSRLVVA